MERVESLDDPCSFGTVRHAVGSTQWGSRREAEPVATSSVPADRRGTGMSDDVSVKRHIEAPAAQVWSMISDITRMGEWSPESTGGSWNKGASGPAVGAKFTGTNRNGRKKWSTTCTVTAAEPGQRFAVRGRRGSVAISSWSFDIVPDGRRMHRDGDVDRSPRQVRTDDRQACQRGRPIATATTAPASSRPSIGWPPQLRQPARPNVQAIPS